MKKHDTISIKKGVNTMSNRLRELRHKKNLTLTQLGKKVGLANNTLSQYETGKREPRLETWQKLADFFQVPVPYLQGQSDIENVTSYEALSALNEIVDKMAINASKKTKKTFQKSDFLNVDTKANKVIFDNLCNIIFSSLALFRYGTQPDTLDKSAIQLAKKLDLQEMDEINVNAIELFKLGIIANSSTEGFKTEKEVYKKINDLLCEYITNYEGKL